MQGCADSEDFMEIERENNIRVKPEVAVHPKRKATVAKYFVYQIEKEDHTALDVVRLPECLGQVI